MRLPAEPLSPLPLLFRGLELGAYGFTKLFMATTLLGFLGLLPTVDMAMRLGDNALGEDPASVLALFNGRWLAVWAAAFALTLLIQAMAIARLDHLAQSGVVDFRTESLQGLRAWLPLVGALLLCVGMGVLVLIPVSLVGLLAGALGAVVVGRAGFAAVTTATIIGLAFCIAVYLLFIQFFVVLERRAPMDSINKSFNLVYRNWWRTFAVLLGFLVVVLGVCILAVIPIVPWLHLTAQPPTGRNLLERGVLQMIGVAVFTPFSLGVLYLLYNDLKLRKRDSA